MDKARSERQALENPTWSASCGPPACTWASSGLISSPAFCPQPQPGATFGSVLPIWGMGEYLVHAHRLALGVAEQSASVLGRFTWEGPANGLSLNWPCPEWSLYYPHKCLPGYAHCATRYMFLQHDFTHVVLESSTVIFGHRPFLPGSWLARDAPSPLHLALTAATTARPASG